MLRDKCKTSDSQIEAYLSDVTQHDESQIESFTSPIYLNPISSCPMSHGEFKVLKPKKEPHVYVHTTTKVLLIGDSNLRNIGTDITSSEIPSNWTINCIPGTNLYLVNKMLLELPKKNPMLTDIKIAARILDSNSSDSHLTTLLNTAKGLKKPIHFQGIAINERAFSSTQKINLSKINKEAQRCLQSNYISPPVNFVTSTDGIHYSTETVLQIFNSRKSYIEKTLN